MLINFKNNHRLVFKFKNKEYQNIKKNSHEIFLFLDNSLLKLRINERLGHILYIVFYYLLININYNLKLVIYYMYYMLYLTILFFLNYFNYLLLIVWNIVLVGSIPTNNNMLFLKYMSALLKNKKKKC